MDFRSTIKTATRRITEDGPRQKVAVAAALMVAVSVLLGAGIAMGGFNRSSVSGPDTVGPGSVTQQPEASSEAPSDSSTTSSSLPSAVPTSLPALSPTAYPTTPGGPSTKKLGWFFFASNKEGVPPTVQAAQQAMCDRYNAIWRGDPSKKTIYITFTMGFDYNNNATRILDIAKEKDVKFTFFVVGNLFKNRSLQPMFLRMYQEGHLIGSHSWNHPMYDEMLVEKGKEAVAADLKKVEDAYAALTGSSMHRIMRFPSGEYSEAALAVMQELGYTTYFWSFAYRDWLVDDQPDPDASLERMVKALHNGAIFYLHTVSDTNVKVLPKLIDEIRARGYDIQLLDTPAP